jgi:hypothetical protein
MVYLLAGKLDLAAAGVKMRRGRHAKGPREMDALISPGTVAFKGCRFGVDLRRLLHHRADDVWVPAAATGSRALNVLAVLLR